MNSRFTVDLDLASLLKRVCTIKQWSEIRRKAWPEQFEGLQALIPTLSTENNTR